MALQVNHPVSELYITATSSQIGTPPVVAAFSAPFRGKIMKVGVVQSGAVTGTTTVTTKINATTVTGGTLTVTGGTAQSLFTASPTAANNFAEDDVISFTPASGTGSATGNFFAIVRRT
jgi:hypothetical protein